ncbi:MAG: hypothetical protein DI616_03400 [Paracoccus denitrificans]|uniref:Uncharacterized protein n=1 Tax=Paracoccus denitrificans TaxID=266 RepID=A0A533IED5_PARDE|nr:MAG: hypothetical protein DI616_03400 [Paracoccus denitrificans]
MTALFFPIFGHYTSIPEGFALPEPDAPTRDLGWAAVLVGTSGTAQGPVLRRFRDGRVTVDAAGRHVTGTPVGGTAPRGWWGMLGHTN